MKIIENKVLAAKSRDRSGRKLLEPASFFGWRESDIVFHLGEFLSKNLAAEFELFGVGVLEFINKKLINFPIWFVL